MLLSTNTNAVNIVRHGDICEAVGMIADAGFDAVDLSLQNEYRREGSGFCKAGYKDEVKRLLETAEKRNIVFNQAHAVYPTSFFDVDKTDEVYKEIVRCIEIAGLLNVKCIVVHPRQHLEYIAGNNANILKKMNIEFYKSLIPYCEEFGVKVAVENMWQKSSKCGHIVDSTCSRPDEFLEYMELIGSRNITACLDIGHCGLVGIDASEYVNKLGKNWLGALHVHDNNFADDEHFIPMCPRGKTDFEGVCKALAGIGYDGDFTFEAENNMRHIVPEVLPALLRFMHDVGRYYIERIGYYKNNN